MRSEKNSTVVIAAGGTGGHVIPALAVAAELAAKNVPVVWCGTRSGLEARIVPLHGIDMHWIDVAGLRGKGLLQTLLGPLKLVHAIWQSARHIQTLKPRAVLGMGGFVSGPVGIAALLMRKPLVLHEQNAVAGMTNRWLSKLATRVFCAWPNVFKSSCNATVVGNPVAADMEALARQPLQIDTSQSQPLKILVVGGSRGAQALNAMVPAAAALVKGDITIHHQTGKDNATLVRNSYAAVESVSVKVSEFIDDMTQAYRCADLVISRAGAMTVTELSALGLPSILVPYPYAVDDHQTLNARRLADAGGALIMPQASLSAEHLAETLSSLAKDRERLVLMSEAARGCFVPEAAATVASALLEVSE